jgi:hypothetical protein
MTVTALVPPADMQAIDNPSADVLRQLGVSRKRWNGLTLEGRLRLVLSRVQRDKEKTEALKRLPQEPFHNPEEDAPVVYFRKTFGGEKSYEYAAIHVQDRGWIITSQQRLGHIPWTGVLQFAMLREATDFDPGFYVASGWDSLKGASE